MLTCQKECVDQNKHNNDLLELLALANRFTLKTKVNKPLWLLGVGTAALLLLFFVSGGGSSPSISRGRPLIYIIFELLLLFIIFFLLLELKLHFSLEVNFLLQFSLSVVLFIESRI